MKNHKVKDHSLHKQLTKTILMYTNASNKAKESVSSKNFHKCRQSLENALHQKTQILAEKYAVLIQHLENYRKKIHLAIDQQLIRNQNHYLQMSRVIETHRVQSKEWLKKRASQTNNIIDEKMLTLQTKLYQITKEQIKSTFENELIEYEQMKMLNIPVFEVKELDVKEFERDIKKYCISPPLAKEEEKPQTFCNLFSKKTKMKKSFIMEKQDKQALNCSKQNHEIHENHETQTIKKEKKGNSDKKDNQNDDLLCEEEINWNQPRAKEDYHKNYIMQDVIVQKSEAEEDSIIYNTQF